MEYVYFALIKIPNTWNIRVYNNASMHTYHNIRTIFIVEGVPTKPLNKETLLI